MNRRALPFLILGAALIWPMLRPAAALAHVFPAAEEPRVGATVNQPPSAVTITFDGRIEALFARLGVSDRGGNDVTAGASSVASDHRRLTVPLKPLAPGDYTVKWSVVAKDGHRTEGSYQFTVGAR